MIKNERQYRISSAEVDRFDEALASRPPTPPKGSGIHPRFWEAEREGMLAQLTELRDEIAAYEALRSGSRRVFGVRHLGDLPRALIEARIAAGLTHKDLGARMKLPEQAIQRYEASDYASASLDRLREVATAIGIEMSGFMALNAMDPTPNQFFQRLKEIGLERRFILDRLLSPSIAAALEAPKKRTEIVSGALLQAATVIERIFKIDPSLLFGSTQLHLNPAATGSIRFKRSKAQTRGKSARQTTEAYTVFAHYLGLLALQATEHIPRRPVPTTPAEWRSAILTRFGSLTLENVLRFFWSVGIPILPLRDEGKGFHGACWRTGGREILVLKQRSLSEDRWIFDALHEGGHIVDEPGTDSFAIIEEEVPWAGDPAEQKATRFAAEIALDGRADELAEQAVELASGDVRSLERAARQVAKDAGVSVGTLANYLAFRIAEDTASEPQPVNWWGTAARLQTQTSDPWRLARDVFLENAELSRLNDLDRELLVRSLIELEGESLSRSRGTN